jgi:lambda repressor-like predicted transcriptional regulator
MATPRRVFDTAPARTLLLARAQDRQLSLHDLADTLRLPPRTLARVLTRTQLRWDTADRIAIALGHHPSELWPSWYDHLQESHS